MDDPDSPSCFGMSQSWCLGTVFSSAPCRRGWEKGFGVEPWRNVHCGAGHLHLRHIRWCAMNYLWTAGKSWLLEGSWALQSLIEVRIAISQSLWLYWLEQALHQRVLMWDSPAPWGWEWEDAVGTVRGHCCVQCPGRSSPPCWAERLGRVRKAANGGWQCGRGLLGTPVGADIALVYL